MKQMAGRVSARVESNQPIPIDPQSAVVRELLVQADLTLPAAARLLDISQHVLRAYCTGERVPRVVLLAMERLVEMERQVKRSAGD